MQLLTQREHMLKKTSISWLKFELILLSICSVLPLLLAFQEVWSNGYLSHQMPIAAVRVFLQFYWQHFLVWLIGVHCFGLFTLLGSIRATSFRRALYFAVFSVIIAFGLNFLIQYIVFNFATKQAFTFVNQVHQFPGQVPNQFNAAVDIMLAPLFDIGNMWFSSSGFPWPAKAILFAVHLVVSFFIAWGLTVLFRYFRTRKATSKKTSVPVRLQIIAKPGYLFPAFLLIPLLLLITSAARPDAPEAGLPNILLVSIDTLRADHLSCYGYEQKTTPAIDALAANGAVFTRAISQSNWTLPSHASMLTALYPNEHNCTIVTGTQLPAKIMTLPELLLEHGYQTFGISSVIFISESYNLAQGFEQFQYRPFSAGEAVDQAIALLNKRQPRPFFMFLHLYDPHDPYYPPDDYRRMFPPREKVTAEDGDLPSLFERQGRPSPDDRSVAILKQLYDGEIRYCDDQLQRLFGWMNRQRLMDNTIVVITSDHGESFGENNVFAHGSKLYSQQIHVPLIVAYPQKIPAQTRIDTLVEASVRLVPTVLNLAGLSADDYLGQPNLFADNADATGLPAHSETFMQMAGQYAVMDDQWKVITYRADGQIQEDLTELYDVQNDWGDAHNLVEQQRDVMRRYLNTYLAAYLEREQAWKNFTAKDVRLGAGELKRLRSLGYLN